MRYEDNLGGCQYNAGGSIQLVASSDSVQIFASSGTLTLPDARVSRSTYYVFCSSGSVTVRDGSSSTIGTVSSGGASVFYLADNSSQAGDWYVRAMSTTASHSMTQSSRSSSVAQLWTDDPSVSLSCPTLYAGPSSCEEFGSLSIPTGTSILYRDAGASGPPYASQTFPRIANDGTTARWQGTVDYSGTGGSATTLVTVSLQTDGIWRLTSDDGFWTDLAPSGVGFSGKYGADWGSAATPVVGFEYATEAESSTATLPCDTGEMVYAKFHAGPALVDAGYGTAVKVSEASGVTTYRGLGLATSTFAGTYVVPYPIPNMEISFDSGSGEWTGPLGTTQTGDATGTDNTPGDVLDYGNGPTDMSTGLYVEVL